MFRALIGLSIATFVALSVGCQNNQKQTASVDFDAVRASSFLSTYRNLNQDAPATWRYIDPNNRLARYNKFIIDEVVLTTDQSAGAPQASPEDLRRIEDYMRQALRDALEPEYQVVTAPAGDVGEIRIGLIDAYRKNRRVGITMQAEVIDAVSNVQIAGLVEAQRGSNIALNRFWTESDAKSIMDDWAQRLRRVVDEAHAAGEAN